MSRQFPSDAAIQSVAPGRARMKGADYYRRRARECQELAAQTVDPCNRDILEQMAGDWLSLVREVEAGASPFLTEIGQKIG
jgi:hypothetical protein